jgi:asparagine N-glycosylation enzyme membrane subunit Stt3
MLRKRIPLLICFVFGAFGLAQYYSPHPIVVSGYSTVLDWVQIIFAFTLIVGVLSVFQIHLKKISRREKLWGYSIVTLSAIVVMASAGFLGGTGRGTAFVWIFDNMQVPMQSTVPQRLSLCSEESRSGH